MFVKTVFCFKLKKKNVTETCCQCPLIDYLELRNSNTKLRTVCDWLCARGNQIDATLVSSNKIGRFFQIFVAFSVYMNFITDVIVIKTWGGWGPDKTLQDKSSSWGDKLILFCLLRRDTRKKTFIILKSIKIPNNDFRLMHQRAFWEWRNFPILFLHDHPKCQSENKKQG